MSRLGDNRNKRLTFSAALSLLVLALSGLSGLPGWAGEVTVERIFGQSEGLFFGARWEEKNGKCELAQAAPGQLRDWKAGPARTCSELRTLLMEHASALKAQYLPKGQKPSLRYGEDSVLLTIGNERIVTTFPLTETCDATLTRCQRHESPPAALVALQVRILVSKALNKAKK